MDRFRNLDYLEHELDILNREEEERIEANEKKLRALQKKLREEVLVDTIVFSVQQHIDSGMETIKRGYGR